MHIHRDICHGMSALSWHPSQGQVQHILMSWHRAFCNLQWGVSALYCSSLNSLSFSQPLSSVIIPIAAFPPMGVPSLVWCYSHPAFKQKLTGAEYLPCTWDFWEVPSLRVCFLPVVISFVHQTAFGAVAHSSSVVVQHPIKVAFILAEASSFYRRPNTEIYSSSKITFLCTGNANAQLFGNARKTLVYSHIIQKQLLY